MIRRKPIENFDNGKYSIGEIVYSKSNIAQKMTVIKCSGMRYVCAIIDESPQVEVIYFEDDLISEWQIPFF
jgi:hypothetical protein